MDNMYTKIQELSAIPGTLAKKRVLKNNPLLIPYIKFALDPQYRYHIKIPDEIIGQGIAFISPSDFSFLTDVKNGVVNMSSARLKAIAIIESMDTQSAELFKMIINRTMRLGLGAKGINDVFPGTLFDFRVMLASRYNKACHKLIYPIYTSPKIDGVRAYYKNGVFYSRTGKVYKGLKHITDILINCAQPGIALDGELAIPNLTFQESSGRIRRNEDAPNAVYWVFDRPASKSILMERLNTLKTYIIGLSSPFIQYVDHISVNTKEEAFHIYQTEHRDKGYEGSVLKNKGSLYQKKRSMDWIKLTNVESIDLRVVDVFVGKGKYLNALGGVICELPNGCIVRVGSGFNDKERITYWNEPRKILGKIIEIEYHELTPDKNLREPRYKGIRYDKDEPDTYSAT